MTTLKIIIGILLGYSLGIYLLGPKPKYPSVYPFSGPAEGERVPAPASAPAPGLYLAKMFAACCLLNPVVVAYNLFISTGKCLLPFDTLCQEEPARKL